MRTTDPHPAGLHLRTWTDASGTHKYSLYIPPADIARPPYALVVFLHGSGESGTDGSKQASVGIMPAVLNAPGRWPCVILAPQKPDMKQLWPAQYETVMAEIAAVRAELPIDESRISLTGLSQGGNGTWMFAERNPRFWSALAPICGFHRDVPASRIAAAVKTIPTWAFHGLKDNVVPPSETRDVIEAIRAAGGNPTLTEYPNADHNSWDAAYRDPALPVWLLSQRRGE